MAKMDMGLHTKIFPEIFSEVAKNHPEKISVSDGKIQLTYSELDKKSNITAQYLALNGIEPGDIIGVCLNRRVDLMVAMIGILKSGAAYLPIDPNLPFDRISFMLKDAGSKLVLTDSGFSENFPANISAISMDCIFKEFLDNEAEIERAKIKWKDLAYILYTSGSTGKPKGVKVSHGNFSSFLESMAMAIQFQPTDSMLAATTVSFDISGMELFLPLVRGGTVQITDTDLFLRPAEFAGLVKKNHFSFVQGTPSSWRLLINSGWNEPLQFGLICGGENISSSLANQLIELAGSFWFGYGPTETTIAATFKKIETPSDITIGRPLKNSKIYVLDDGLNPAQDGTVGEICIGGMGVAQGYVNLPELSSQKFVPDPFVGLDGASMYRSGDLGKFLPNGELVFVGRVDDQIKIRGYRIEPGEIESALNKVDGVKESAVIAMEDPEGGSSLVGYLVCGQSFLKVPETERTSDLRKKLITELPPYMVPTYWVFMDQFPLTTNNKIDRNKLPGPALNLTGVSREKPSSLSENEMLVENIWSRLLKVKPINKRDNFFEIGGHSLLAVEVMSELEKKTERKLPLNIIFKYPTIAGLASFLGENAFNSDNWSSLVEIKPSGNKPPLYIIHGAGSVVSIYFQLARYMEEDQPVFGFQPLGLDGHSPAHSSLEEMAEYYLKMMLKHNPEGPYFLAGYSFGGFVAFEMARQMAHLGIALDRLILFDTPTIPDREKLTTSKKINLKLNKRLTELRFFINEPKAFIQLKGRSIRRKKDAFLKLLFRSKVKSTDKDNLKVIRELTKNNNKLIDHYTLKKYDGDMHLFQVKNRWFYVEEPKYFGWLSYVNQVKVVKVSGHHDNLFTDPKILPELAGKIQSVLDASPQN